MGRYTGTINTGRKNGFTERQRLSQMRDKDHLCTPLYTFDARQMFTFQASLQAIKAVFVTPLTLTLDAPQRYI